MHTQLAVLLLPLVASRPCAEPDIYPGHPLPRYHPKYGRARPYPELVGCTLLDLANTKMTRDEAYTLTRAIAYPESGEFRNISVVRDIATVSLGGVPVADAGATVLADAFGPRPNLPHFIRLALGATELTDVGASALAGAIGASGSTIASLRLDWNAIGNAGGTSLGHALRNNERLEDLGLERCGVGDAGAAELAAALGGSSGAEDASAGATSAAYRPARAHHASPFWPT